MLYDTTSTKEKLIEQLEYWWERGYKTMILVVPVAPEVLEKSKCTEQELFDAAQDSATDTIRRMLYA